VNEDRYKMSRAEIRIRVVFVFFGFLAFLFLLLSGWGIL
jgi:hypothetical protein